MQEIENSWVNYLKLINLINFSILEWTYDGRKKAENNMQINEPGLFQFVDSP